MSITMRLMITLACMTLWSISYLGHSLRVLSASMANYDFIVGIAPRSRTATASARATTATATPLLLFSDLLQSQINITVMQSSMMTTKTSPSLRQIFSKGTTSVPVPDPLPAQNDEVSRLKVSRKQSLSQSTVDKSSLGLGLGSRSTNISGNKPKAKISVKSSETKISVRAVHASINHNKARGEAPIAPSIAAPKPAAAVDKAKTNAVEVPNVTVRETKQTSSSRQDQATAKTPANPTRTTSKKKTKWEFVPYPHLPLPEGDSATCEWTTAGSLLGLKVSEMDSIQRAASKEGVCLYQEKKNKKKKNKKKKKQSTKKAATTTAPPALHIFSQQEAIECLSGADRITFTGDSYTRQMFIGLRDILMGDANQTEIPNSVVRGEILDASRRELKLAAAAASSAKAASLSSPFPNIDITCVHQCYGRPLRAETREFQDACASCLSEQLGGGGAMNRNNTNSALFVGAGVHIFNYHGESVGNTLSTVKNFFQSIDQNVVWVSMPAYVQSMIPHKYRSMKSHHPQVGRDLYSGILKATREYHHRFLDVYHLTQSCTMKKCTLDGTHRSRFVNRWKAQMALNMLCRRAN